MRLRQTAVNPQKVKASFCTVFLVLFSVLLSQGIYAQFPDAGNILYVNTNATGNGTGNSWANAVKELADAMKWARQQNNFTPANPLKIYVAKGTYKPKYTPRHNANFANEGRDNAFLMVNNVQLYGGFDPANGITDLTDTRIYGSGGSVLSGDIGIAGLPLDNVCHVVISAGDVGSARLDGFTVTGAYSSTSDATTGSFYVNGLGTQRDFGGGMLNRSSSPTITNCTFTGNTANGGGGMSNRFSSSPEITNCIFTGNSASSGGGMYNYSSSPAITNCRFTGNTIVNSGGGIFNTTNASPTITNTTIADNGSNGFYVYGSGSAPSLINSIVWDDIAKGTTGGYFAHYSLIKGFNLHPGAANVPAVGLSGSDIFNNYSAGDYTLKAGSPALNVGSNYAFSSVSTSTVDLAGKPRMSGTIDAGAYEYQAIPAPDANNILYVNTSQIYGDATGRSWADAIPNLADAMKWARQQNNFTAANPLKIYVAKGTYKPMYHAADDFFTVTGSATGISGNTDRDNAFVMVSNVQVYGGFDPDNGIADLTDTRDYTNTILSGDISTPGTATDNTYHVLISAGDVGSALLDGFTVTGAHSAASGTASILVNSIPIGRGVGGGMYNSSSSPAVSNCSFTGNTAVNGGGMANNSSSPAVSNCSFTGNTATVHASGMFNLSSSPAITNCIFTGNTANDGGGMRNDNSSPTITNCTFAGNGSNAFYITGAASNPVFQNSIVWDVVTTVFSGSYTASHSLIKGENPSGTGNINATGLLADDVFNNYSGGDYALRATSPAVNAGSSTLYPASAGMLDLAEKPRFYGAVVDMGAYEYQSIVLIPGAGNVLYVNASVSGGDGRGSSWANAVTNLSDALLYARYHYHADTTVYDATPLKIYVAAGTYKPLYNAADDHYSVTGSATAGFTDRDNAFVMVKNVQVYGGFDPANGIADLTDTRDYTNTILSGDIGAEGTATDNAYHVLISSGDVGAALLDGFTVTGAYYPLIAAAGEIYVNGTAFTRSFGGGMYNGLSSPAITHCTFTGNAARDYGGGMVNGLSSPAITDCIFTGNSSNHSGGGMYNANSSPVITYCSFTGNTAVFFGGGMYNSSSSSPPITNSIFTGNTAANNGGAMHNYSYSSPIITNTTIANNGSNGFGVQTSTSNPVFQNTIVWDEISLISASYTATYSLIKGANPSGTGNINAISLAATDVFMDYANADYTLKSSSSAVNAGNNSYNSTATDLAGNARISSGTIDLGAYEFPGTLPIKLISFTAEEQETSALLQWKTTAEQGNRGFEIQHSTNALEWKQIGFRASLVESGNSSMTLAYAYTHSNPTQGQNYYRLKQTDFDGSYAYSPIRVLAFSRLAEVKAYPNPTREATTVELGAEQIGSRVRLVSTAGVVLQEITVKEPVLSIPLSGYPAGIYLLHTADGKVMKVVKE